MNKGWLEERRGPRLRPPDPPTFECSKTPLVKRSGAVSEESAKGGRRARVGRCVQNSEEFSEENVFSCIFRPSRLSENSAYDPEATTPPNQPAQTAYRMNWGGDWVGGYPTRL